MQVMFKIIIIALILLGSIITIGLWAGITASKNPYFSHVSSKDRLESIEFYVKKHTIFRRFAMIYSVIHYSLTVSSIITTLITVYMVMDESGTKINEVVFLLLAAIFSNVTLSLRFDKVGGCYAQAMRVLEKAILTYLGSPDESITLLVNANADAEQIIENNYF